MTYIKTIKSDNEIKDIYTSLNAPLLIINQSVYQINSECIVANFGKERTGGGSGDNERDTRHSGGSDNEKDSRASGGSSDRDARHSGGSSNTGDDEKNTRRSGSSTTSDKGGSRSNVRNSGGAIPYYCEMNTLTKKLILHIGSVSQTAKVRVFYDNAFIDSKYYKIKSL